MKSGVECPMCADSALPSNNHSDLIAELPGSYSRLHRNQTHAGYAVLISKRHAVDRNGDICVAGHANDFSCWLTHQHSYLSIREMISDCPQRRQTHYYITELPEIYDQNVSWIEGQFKIGLELYNYR